MKPDLANRCKPVPVQSYANNSHHLNIEYRRDMTSLLTGSNPLLNVEVG